jgi:hypothetical protein
MIADGLITCLSTLYRQVFQLPLQTSRYSINYVFVVFAIVLAMAASFVVCLRLKPRAAFSRNCRRDRDSGFIGARLGFLGMCTVPPLLR